MPVAGAQAEHAGAARIEEPQRARVADDEVGEPRRLQVRGDIELGQDTPRYQLQLVNRRAAGCGARDPQVAALAVDLQRIEQAETTGRGADEIVHALEYLVSHQQLVGVTVTDDEAA